MSTPNVHQLMNNQFDNKWQSTDSGQPKRRRNRSRKNRSRNRQPSESMASQERHYDNRYEGRSGSSRYERRDSHQYERRPDSRPDRRYYEYRPRTRTESNVSLGARSTASAMTNTSNSGRSYVGSDQRSGQQMSRNLRWDRDRLSKEIWRYFETHCQTKDMLTRKNRLKEALHKILTTSFTDYDVNLYIVGSTATGLADNQSDVDICIVMKEIGDEKSSPGYVNSADDDNQPLVKIDSTSHVKQEEGVKGAEDTEKTEATPLETVVDTESQKEAQTEIDPHNDSTDSGHISTNGKTDPSIPMLEKIEKELKKYNFVTKMQIILAKVPILKFNDRISGIEVTLNVNKLVSIRNTLLIQDYTKLDWRVQPLVLVIKAWAKDHNIKDAYNKSLSSYSLVLMVIHYLQYGCEPAVLPCLQQLDPKRYDPESDIHSIRMNSRPKRWKSRNELSLKDLLIGFLDYYSYSFCFSKDAISVRLGQPLPKHLAQRYKSDDNAFCHWKYISIEEPFSRSNTARSVYDPVMFEHILAVFRVSHYTLRRYPFLDSIMAGKQFSNDYIKKPDTTVHKNELNLYFSDLSPIKSPSQPSEKSAND